MIFITVGTENFPFDRLFKSIDEAVARGKIKDDIFAQTGHSQCSSDLYAHEEFIDFNRELDLIRKADIVVCHAGTGSTSLCLSQGKIPIIFPRQSRFKEHIDDHQVEFAKKFEESGKVLTAYTGKELVAKIKNYRDYVAKLKPFHQDTTRHEFISHLTEICERDI